VRSLIKLKLEYDILINTTSVGMEDDNCPVSEDFVLS
jgi:shikimate 5-dehydrogenase